MSAEFRRRVEFALADPHLGENLDINAEHMSAVYAEVFGEIDDLEAQREMAHGIRRDVIENLDTYLQVFTQNLERNGWFVHSAADAEQACEQVIALARAAGADRVVKSKSLLTEEIGLNHALTAAGIRPVETDLGEFIIQLRGEAPSHIIAPAMHLNRHQIGETFSEKLGMPPTDDISRMNATARAALREHFLSARVGISGVNFGIAESGIVCLLTNEGNGRMVTTLPPTHIAIMGAERLLRRVEDLPLMLSFLSRAGAGQRLSTYQSLLRTPRGAQDPDGPSERHIIIVDNGRLALRGGELAEVLLCIRCGACLDVCPVYREIGGHSYGSVYPGPIGSVLSPGLFGVRRFGHLAKASTLCGACYDICPVKIDLPTLLLRVRRMYASQDQGTRWIRWALRLYAWTMRHPRRYKWARRLLNLTTAVAPKQEGWLHRLPYPASEWTGSRHFPPAQGEPLRDRFRPRKRSDSDPTEPNLKAEDIGSPGQAPDHLDPVEEMEIQVTHLGGEFHRIVETDLPGKIDSLLTDLGVQRVLIWDAMGNPALERVITFLRRGGYDLIHPRVPKDELGDRLETNASLAEAGAGLTGAAAAFARTGTLVLPQGPGQAAITSLLPPLHIAILYAEDVYSDMTAWIEEEGKQLLESTSSTLFVSGPSRTGDIEMALTLGVHGPGRLVIFCLHG